MKIILPTNLTFSEIETPEALTVINAILTKFGKPTITLGSPNPFFLKILNLSVGGGLFQRGAEYSICEIENEHFVKLTDIQLICAAQGNVKDYEVFFVLDSLDDEVPETFPERTFLEDEVEKVHTWATWGSPDGRSHQPIKHGDKWYRINRYGVSGVPMDAAHWINQPNLMTVQDYLKVVAANTPNEV